MEKEKIPDPYKDARQETEILKSNRNYYLNLTFDRIVNENPYIDKKRIVKRS